MADEFDFSDYSWIEQAQQDLDDTLNLDFSYDPSTAGIFSFNPDNMVFDDIFDTDVPSFSGDYDQYFADSGDWIKGLQENLDDPFDFSYDPFDPTDPNDVWEWNPDSLGDPTNYLKELYPDLYPEEIDSSIFEMPEDEYQGIFGLGIGPKLNQFFTGGQGLASILTGGGGDGKKGGGSGGLLGGEGLLGGSGLETLIKLAMINKLRKQDRDDPNEVVPIGSDAFSAVGQGLGSMPDYRIFNLQPALMPGVGYANAPPPEMKHGGLASLDEGPGDITLARLEPGEFVMTRKATDNIGAKNLYRLMKEAERMG